MTGFARPNLVLSVRRSVTADEQQRDVVAAVADTTGSGIVYCRTRRGTEEYAATLRKAGVEANFYHAGLGKSAREEAHRRFVDGDVNVMVATSAFGMGIDKPDIRFVFHAQVPESPDTYYQEFGRAGRDGDTASAVLFYRPEDLSLGRFFVGGIPKHKDVARVVTAIHGFEDPDRDALREATGLGPRKLGRILNLVELVCESSPDGPPRGIELVTAVLRQAEAQRSLEDSRVEMMRGYAETRRCRWDFMLGYFGDDSAQLCGHCDNCESGSAQRENSVADISTYRLQSRVTHPEFGPGLVMDVEEDRLTILFDEVGYRTLALDIVEREGLLAEAAPAS